MQVASIAKTLTLAAFGAGSAAAQQDVDTMGKAFADHCFSPYLTAEKAKGLIASSGARVDFYDLRPFSSAAPSPVTGRAATTGTDRRCEVAFDGAHVPAAFGWVKTGLRQEGLTGRLTGVPENFTRQTGVTEIAAVQLNPNRIAVAQVGLRSGPNGEETFINVERLTPLNEARP